VNTDLDLHVIEPNGEEISWKHMKSASSGAKLDQDFNPNCSDRAKGTGVETISWVADKVPVGLYSWKVILKKWCQDVVSTTGRHNLTWLRVTKVVDGKEEEEEKYGFNRGQFEACYNSCLSGPCACDISHALYIDLLAP
jgi:uncharacterized protein YfaP (DUF2135 family)